MVQLPRHGWTLLNWSAAQKTKNADLMIWLYCPPNKMLTHWISKGKFRSVSLWIPLKCAFSVTCAFCKIFLFARILIIFECDDPWEETWPRILKNLEGNVFRETYPDVWHLDSFSGTLPKATRNDWVTGMATGLQGTHNPVGLPIVWFVYCFRLAKSRTTLKWVMSVRFSLSQEWVLGAGFARLQQM